MSQTLRLDHVRKYFGSQRALDDVSVEFQPASIHAIVGANGAGKSTLGWLLAGRFRDYGGRIFLGTRVIELRSRHDALEHSIGVVTQEPALALNLSVAANLFLGVEPVSGSHLIQAGGRLRRAAHEYLREFGLNFNPAESVVKLSLDQRQTVDLLRAYYRKPRFLVVDEPSLAYEDFAASFLGKVLRGLRESGATVILITHHVSKALNIADRITVLRDGQVVANKSTSACTEAEILGLMFPSISVEKREREVDRRPPSDGVRSFDIHFKGDGCQSPRELSVNDGCVTGLQTKPFTLGSKILRAVVAIDDSCKVDLVLDGKPLAVKSPKDALKQRLVYLSADRELDGVFPSLTVRDNLTFDSLATFSSMGFIRRERQRAIAKKMATQVKLDPQRIDDLLKNLSGGNQQRTMLGRVIGTDPIVCLLDEPNRGVDVASLPVVESLIRALARHGRWVLISSTDEAFLRSVSDRVLELES